MSPARTPRLCKYLWMNLRMKFSAGCLQCRPAEASRCYELLSQTQDVFAETFEQRDASFASTTNTQMNSEAKATRIYYKGFAEASHLCPML